MPRCTDRIPVFTLVALLAGIATPAFAQDAPPADDQPATRADALSGDIVVTARKFKERVQDVPVAISAFSGEAIAARGVDNIEGLATFTPNMTFQSNPSFGGASSSAAIYIRGIGQKEFLPTTEPGVGVYVDGVYVARSVGAMLDLVDVERVEVLRGPQGTLFGRNTIGGALSLTTVKPKDDWETSGQLTVGNFKRIDAKLMVNIPLGDTLALRVSGASLLRDGYVRRLSDGLDLGNVNTKTGRAQLRWSPSSKFEINLAVDATEDRNNGPALTLKGVNLQSAIFNPGNLPVLPPGSTPRAGYYVANPPADAPVDNFALLNNYVATFLGGQNCLSFAPYSPTGPSGACYDNRYVSGTTDAGTAPQYSHNRIWGTSGTIDWDLGVVQIKSITAYRRLDGEFSRDGDHSPLTISQFYDDLVDKQFSQELQVLGKAADGHLKYVIGGYYFDERGNDINILDFTPVNFRSGGKFSTRSYAAFGQATLTLGTVDLSGGLRYTKDDKTFLPDQIIFTDRTPGALLIAGSPNTPKTRVLPYVEVKRSEDALTPMANIAWHVTGDAMLYASYSQGFKSGGFVQRVFPPLAATPQFGAEKATAYEAGFKTEFLGRKLTLNGAVFLTKYDNLQVQVFTGVAPVTKNAAKAEIKGAELEMRLSPGDGWFLEGSAGYLDPKYTEIDPAATEITTASKFERISKWTLSASLAKSFALGGGSALTPRVDWSYRSGQYMDALNTPEIYQPGYHVVNASVAIDIGGKGLSIVGGVTNLTDERYLETGIYGTSFRSYETLYARPREWYVTLKWKI